MAGPFLEHLLEHFFGIFFQGEFVWGYISRGLFSGTTGRKITDKLGPYRSYLSVICRII